MPTYEYRCKECGRHLEVVQSFKDDPLTECPHCGGELKKVFGNVGIAFKGSGFYKTDSRSSSKSGKERSKEKESSTSPTSESKSSESKSSESKSSDSKSSDSKSSESKPSETKSRSSEAKTA
jgi:putative FmdB family regulatory protein